MNLRKVHREIVILGRKSVSDVTNKLSADALIAEIQTSLNGSEYELWVYKIRLTKDNDMIGYSVSPYKNYFEKIKLSNKKFEEAVAEGKLALNTRNFIKECLDHLEYKAEEIEKLPKSLTWGVLEDNIKNGHKLPKGQNI